MRLVVCLFILIIAASSGFAEANEGKALFEKKCIKCHTLERALGKTKNLAAWRRTTSRMSRYAEQAGDTITPEEAVMIAEFLANRGKEEETGVEEKEVKKEIKQMMDIEKHEMFEISSSSLRYAKGATRSSLSSGTGQCTARHLQILSGGLPQNSFSKTPSRAEKYSK
jgi:cytochrome c